MPDLVTIKASQWVAPQRAVTDSAEDTAHAIVEQLRAGNSVEVDLTDVRGVPSSYFNLILIRIAEAHGLPTLERVTFRFASAVQRTTYERSAHAVRESFAA